MNKARTTYQSDFTPFDWLQNNVMTDMNEFCTSENVDECLKYISQEFSALGFPSIYSCCSGCPSDVNCDIVKFLNVTYELLRSNSEHIQKNEDLVSSNQRLCTDLNFLSKKNSLLKTTLEQTERKLTSTLERERQLKEKNEQLLQQLKLEKEENKKLSGLLRQEKVAYQHEIRKYENNMNHIKGRINQLLSDKNPNKKIATMTTSQTLPRNSGQRGKWKTGVATSTAVEDMYNSVLLHERTQMKELCTEVNLFRECLQSVVSEIVETISILQQEIDNDTTSKITKEFALNEVKKCWDASSYETNLKYFIRILKECAMQKIYEVKKSLESQLSDLKQKLPEHEKSPKDSCDSQQVTDDITTPIDKKKNDKSLTEEFLQLEKTKIDAEKLNLSKEKAEIVSLLRLAIQQKTPESSWHESIKTYPSISVITSPQNESPSISNLNYLKYSFRAPEQLGQSNNSFSPQWKSDELVNNTTFCKISDTTLPFESLSASQSSAGSPLPIEMKFSNSDLPAWASNKSESPSIAEDIQCTTVEISHAVSSNEDLLNESSNEDINMLKLKAAMEDIEKRRTTP